MEIFHYQPVLCVLSAAAFMQEHIRLKNIDQFKIIYTLNRDFSASV